MTKKSTKKALLMSALSLLLCCAMLVGSTFAWFSDSVKTGTNTIVAGNLDIGLQLQDAHGSWEDAGDSDILFDGGFDDLKWEPGMMEVSSVFRLANEGNLNLWYSLSAKLEETADVKTGVKLSDVIKMAVVDAQTYKSESGDLDEHSTYEAREALWNKLTEESEVSSITDFVETGTIAPGKNSSDNGQVIVLFWENNNEKDNEYNLKDSEMQITAFGLNVYATQTPDDSEKDSFGSEYDKGAMEVAQITAVFEEKIGGLNSELSAALSKVAPKFENAITVNTSTTEDGVVKAAFNFTNAFENVPTNPGNTGNENTKAMATAFTATASKIAQTLIAEKDNISLLTIVGQGEGKVDFTDVTEETKEFRQKLGGALKTAVMKNVSSGDNPITLTVNVVTKNGATVSYALDFTFDNSTLNSGKIGTGYIASLVRALQDWENDGSIHDGTYVMP